MTTIPAQPVAGLLGRLPQRAPADRFPIKFLHEYDSSVAPEAPVVYPVDVSQGIADWLMLANGPDPTLTITTPNGVGQPVGDCYFAAYGHDTMLAGSHPTADGIAGEYDTYDAGVDQGVVVADALLWQHQRGDIGLFAPVHPDALCATMAKYNRGILMGVNLTGCDQSNFPAGWTASASCQPDPTMGHVVYLVILNADGSGAPVSWGQKVPTDQAWMKACPEEWWLILTAADRRAMGEAAYDALAADLAALPNSTGTAPASPVVTPPAPVVSPPAPSPAPPVPVEPPAPPIPAPAGIIPELEKLAHEAIQAIVNLVKGAGGSIPAWQPAAAATVSDAVLATAGTSEASGTEIADDFPGAGYEPPSKPVITGRDPETGAIVIQGTDTFDEGADEGAPQ